jgi:hypothetical protein
MSVFPGAGLEFLQGQQEILAEIFEFPRACRRSGNDYIVMTGLRVKGQQFCCEGPQAAAGTVAHDGVADFAAGRQAIAKGGSLIRDAERTHLNDKSRRHPFFSVVGDVEEFFALQ